MSIRRVVLVLSIPLPWFLKLRVLNLLSGFDIHPSARIGWSWLGMKSLVMGEASRIGHLNFFKSLDRVQLGEGSSINRLNLFTCIASENQRHYQHISGRRTVFVLGRHSRVTMRHLFDCNEAIEVGDFVTLAGYQSQYLTHSVDVIECRQDASPIRIGDNSFVGTRVVILGGAVIPERSVIAASAVVRGILGDPGVLYGGVPARPIKQLPRETKYWYRSDGWIA